MSNNDGERVGPMLNPPHLGELIRESMEEIGWNVTETAVPLGLRTRDAFASLERQSRRVRKYGAGIGAHRLGTAEHWMRMQASYELAQARRERGH